MRWLLGSSPLTRGALSHGIHAVNGFRLIPAHAGSTPPVFHDCHANRAHPRSRGEHIRLRRLCGRVSGSSPLTRGAPLDCVMARATTGLIPAHAGSTSPAYALITYTRAHPRSRGEHGRYRGGPRPFGGSSPLTRGAQQKQAKGAAGIRLIPAHAGSTMVPGPRTCE